MTIQARSQRVRVEARELAYGSTAVVSRPARGSAAVTGPFLGLALGTAAGTLVPLSVSGGRIIICGGSCQRPVAAAGSVVAGWPDMVDPPP
ncbi:hypothetical protein Nm8I071_55560 [Nonomuraea sp. TT08I-71]|nr:hypothetical protein Nm8I071_55560 [Nonomuraea sp. TT08I-71]